MGMGRSAAPPLPEAPPQIDPAKEQAKIEAKAREDALAAMRGQARRRGSASTLLAGGYDKSTKLGAATLLGG